MQITGRLPINTGEFLGYAVPQYLSRLFEQVHSKIKRTIKMNPGENTATKRWKRFLELA